MIDINTGRTWKNAPSGVRDARTLAWLGVIFSGLAVFVLILQLASTGRGGGLGASAVILVYALLFPLYIWLLIGLKRGARAAYYAQLIVSILGLIGFPIGTLINAYILYKWSRPETKAWFGV